MSESQQESHQFGRIRSFIWPIHRSELMKFLPMLLIFFLITFNYNVLRTMKDTLVVTAKHSGAEVIPFIKVWVMFPGSILMTFLFTRLSNRYDREKVFYLIMSIFLVYFFLFTFVLYPNRDFLHPNATADALQQILPAGFKGPIAMFRNWTFSVFYAMSELWSNIIFALLLWGFTNQITRSHESKRFYGLFGFGANLSGIFAGLISVYLSSHLFNPNLFFGSSAWEQSMMMLVSLVLFSGVLSLLLFRWINKNVLTDPRYYDHQEAAESEKVKGKLSMRENFSYLFKSKYLINITIVVIAYNIVINLVEVVWKSQMKELYPDPSAYSRYFNEVSTVIGFVSTIAALLVSGNSVRKFGWTFTAMLTPIIFFVTSIGFFGLYFLKMNGSLEGLAMTLLGVSPLTLVVFAGSLQNVFCRGAKYTVFDATREMAFVPLSLESKLKGKAAIDGVCNRLGKSGGSVIHQGLLLTFASFAASAPYVAAIAFFVMIFWAKAVRGLGTEFNQITSTDSEVRAVGSEEELAFANT